jgi:phenylacetate-CoA ligase
VVGPGVAQECAETKDGLTIWEDNFYPEVIDPVTGEVLPDGADGELVFTSLTRQASPVIRYRTRDLTRLLPGTARPAMRRMARVTGRSDDMVIVRGVNLFPTQVEEIVLRTPGLSPHFTLEVTTRGRLDHLTVKVEARPDCEAGRRALASAEVVAAVRSSLGLAVKVDVVDPETLPRSMGKLRRLYDLRDRG